jgi:hypothetical protein
MPAEPQEDFSVEESIPEGAASLESILCTEELRRPPWRPPDYEKETSTGRRSPGMKAACRGDTA